MVTKVFMLLRFGHKREKYYTIVTIVSFLHREGHFGPKTQQTGHKVSRKRATV